MTPLCNVIVLCCGSRGWTDKTTIFRFLADLPPGVCLVHGGAYGADDIAAAAADELGIHQLVCWPDYEMHGRRAPHVRNDDMLNMADRVVAFWDGVSRGTKSVIDKARKLDIPIEVVTLGREA